MSSIEVPEVCALAINNLPIVGRPIWRLTEGKHIVKLEITWQLPRSTTTRWSNQPSKRKMPADGVTGDQDGMTKMADQSKIAAPTLSTTTDTLNVARCASPSASLESREKTPPRPSTPSTAAVTTTDQPQEREWKVLSRKKSTPKKPSCASTPKEQPMPQRRRIPSPPKKKGSAAEVACTASTQWKGGKDYHRSWKGFSTSREVWPGWSGFWYHQGHEEILHREGQ